MPLQLFAWAGSWSRIGSSFSRSPLRLRITKATAKCGARIPSLWPGGECEFTRYGFRDLIGGGCVDIAQPDLACAGGFSGWLDILALAKSYGVATIPHVWGSGIAVAAALHAVASIPPFPHTANPLPLLNEPVIEFDRKHNPLRDELLVGPFTLKDGRLMVPDRPGLGVTVRTTPLRPTSDDGSIAFDALCAKNVLITGAAAGLGRHIAQAFAAEGADIAILDFQDASATAREITALKRRCEFFRSDVRDEDEVKTAVARGGRVLRRAHRCARE